jgi:ATP-dependent helicase HrpB
MSATLQVELVAQFLDDCPAVRVHGAPHPLVIEHAPGESPADAVARLVPRTAGQLLCFLPGAREIERVRTELTTHGAVPGLEVVPLHGSLDADA